MNTPAHVLLAAVVTARPNQHRRNWAMMAGALIPDMMMFVMVAWERWINGLTAHQIFSDAYFSAHWQKVFAVSNSIPIYATVLLLGLALKIEIIWVFGLCALLHVVFDLPLHTDDGHPHFWPVSDWIFASPVSYWDPNHHGIAAGMMEAGFSIGLCVLLWQRFTGLAARMLIAAGLAVELLFSVGGHLVYGLGLGFQ